jgi:hypothetical protein
MRTLTLTSKTHGAHDVLLDDEDYDRVVAGGKWLLSKTLNSFYAIRHSRRPDGVKTTEKMHAVVSGEKGVDHINGNGLDNRRENLRSATHAQNCQNHPLSRRNTSGYRGVWFSKIRGKWIAEIRLNDVKTVLGEFGTAAEAGAVARSARERLMPFTNEARCAPRQEAAC